MRALYEWIVDNGCTPYVVVNALRDDVQIPRAYVKDGQIVLNVSPSAVIGLNLSNEGLMFNARFAGVAMDVYAPIGAVLGIYARENGQGMVFEAEDNPPDQPPGGSAPMTPADKAEKPKRPGLKVVK
ncbi:MAG TPA: ClpXP protease specificity-enhancing factor [Spongiibacteraceae bacterium]|nr:ClpXP protease specificity-enhancing factor [Spongiibacteraceae bacterium]